MLLVAAPLTACNLFGGGGEEPTYAPEPTAAPVTTLALAAPATATTPGTSTPAVPATPMPSPITAVDFTGVVTNTGLPSQVQTVFSLRDQNGHPIVLPAKDIQQATRIYELRVGSGARTTPTPATKGGLENFGWEEIDYSETSFFVHTAENFDLEVVFVLDFTNSMAQTTLPDGRSGIEAMIEAFESGLAVLPGAHRIGAVEFHDRNVDPRVLSALTTDRAFITDRVREFMQSGFDPGSSRVWDSIVTGVDLFSSRHENPRAIRALVFLSDGRDTSSVNVREDAGRYALEHGVQLYAMGVGEVFQEADLRQMANTTDGAYYSAPDPSLLQQQLQMMVNDLRGQYQVSYITLRREGEYRAAIEIELDGITGLLETSPFDVATFFGSDNQGLISFDPPSIDRSNNRATVFARALHIPRNIDRIQFRLDTSKPIELELVRREDGGLLDGWTLSGPDSEGSYEASSSETVEFGNFGPLFKLTVSDVTEESLEIPVEFDNSIYAGDKRLVHISNDSFMVNRLWRVGASLGEGDLVESWELSEDGLDYTMFLKQGARFQDGRPIQAKDVGYSLAVMHETWWSAPAFEIDYIDDLTLRVIFVEPYLGFAQDLAADPRAVIVPRENP